MTSHESSKNLKSLGSTSTEYPTSYAPHVLERIPNTHAGKDSVVLLDCPEFTSLCPKTHQPDFARIEIKYKPGAWLVESKSLKLYLFSFRNHGEFHEECVNRIADDLTSLLEPLYLEVVGHFFPRGGIAIIPTATRGAK